MGYRSEKREFYRRAPKHAIHTYERHMQRRYTLVRWIALLQLLLGVLCFLLGVGDLAYTVAHYADCDPTQFRSYDPCGANLNFTWAATPLWCGVMFIACAVMGLMAVQPWRKSQFWLDIYGGFCLIVCLVFAPIVIIVCSLEIYDGVGHFYYTSDLTNDLSVYDETKLALPVTCVVMAALVWCLCCVITIMFCLCSPRESPRNFFARYAGYRNRPPPFADKGFYPIRKRAPLKPPQPPIRHLPTNYALKGPRYQDPYESLYPKIYTNQSNLADSLLC